MEGISRKFLAKLVGKSDETVKSYFYRKGLSKDNPEHVKEYLIKFL